MKVVLLKDLKGAGKKDELVEVSDGYARNYLFPRGIAAPATASAVNEVEAKNKAKQHRAEQELEQAREQANKIDKKQIKITAKAGEGGRLFGSVTAKEIAAAVERQLGVEVDKRKIALASDIKAFGSYDVQIKVHAGVVADVTVVVTE